MSDLIDREALLRQIDIDSDGEPGYYGDTWKFIDTIKSMPSAEHGTNLAEVGTDCISREQAIDALEKWLHGLFGITEADGTATIFKTIRQLPPIQPEIVRCKDCKHRYVDGGNVRYNACELNHNNVQSDDWFCADGER